jgi:alpha-L-rhamnosidase
MSISRFLLTSLAAGWLAAQGLPSGSLDPTAEIEHPRLESSLHRPLPEEYIWTAGDAQALSKISYDWAKQSYKAAPHFFRRTFTLASVPKAATLYVAGPRLARIFLNGKLVDEVASDLDHPLGMHVFSTDVAAALHAGANSLALEVVRGRGISGFANSPKVVQQTFGEVLVVKLAPAARGIEAPPLLISDGQWKSTLEAASGWQQPGFDDHAWPPVQSLGCIESDIDFFQWSGDAGLYDWPGYDGISPFLARYELAPVAVTHVFEGRSKFENLPALTRVAARMIHGDFDPSQLKTLPVGSPQADFAVRLAAPNFDNPAPPSLMLDFGREVVGRVEFVSDSDAPVEVVVGYGESEEEAHSNQQYLGVNPLYIAPHATARGPKSAFRYVLVRFVAGDSPVRFRAIRLDGIYYPVRYQGSFESSDAMLNRIWTVGAYTAHLCMQDDIWDAPKRDRGRWMGDLDVSGHVIGKVFADRFLMEDTMTHLIGPEPVTQHVNGIAGYSAYWMTGEADYYRHIGSREHLASIHQRLIELQRYMDTELDENHLYANVNKSWPFVDWAPDLYGDTAEARRGTQIEFYRAYREGAWLLRELGDTAAAEHFEQRAAVLKQAADHYLFDSYLGTWGTRWQVNAMAVLSDLAGPKQYAVIWGQVLSQLGHQSFSAWTVSPYYNYYVVSAMARMGHRGEALDWIRKYWGGMLDEGATTFWESYDLNWPKDKSHISLEADGTSGFFVSLDHGWSSGPTAWLMEEILGILPTARGFDAAVIRPDLADLEWAKGVEPTPHGPIRIGLKKNLGVLETTLDLPAGMETQVLLPSPGPGRQITVNGQPVESTPAENGTRARIRISAAGHYEVHS